MKIPFVDLSCSSNAYKKKFSQKLKKVITTGNFILGKELENFEKKFAEYIGTKYCIGVASGTDALLLGIKALGIGKGDEVIIPALSFIATATAVIHSGATPVFVDILDDLPLIDPSEIEQKITKKTKAIIPVHLHGYPCEMKTIQKLSKKYMLPILEDACQSHGSLYHKKHTGSFGNIAAFSFYPGKNLGAYGDAGMIATSDKKLAEKIFILRNHGSKHKYLHKVVGYNSRLDNLQAAILNIKLDHLDEQNFKRLTRFQLYSKLLNNLPVKIPRLQNNIVSNHHVYAISSKKRDLLKIFLESKGISCGIHYPVPLHLHRALSFLNNKEGDFPNAEKFACETLSLPMYPELSNRQIKYVCKQINMFYNG